MELRSHGSLTEHIKRPEQSHSLLRFWENATGFWGKRVTRLSWILSGILLLTIVLNLVTSYSMNVWTRGIFDALQERDSHTILFLSMVYLPLLAASVVFSVLEVYARMMIQRRGGEWLTNQLIKRWLKNGRYYHLNLVSNAPKNPEYRVADDVRIATESPVDFITGMITAVLSAATFIVILWTIGGSLPVPLGGTFLNIPRFFVLAAFISSDAASGVLAF